MAYVNVAEWSPDQVSEWLKGLDDVILPYIHYFVNNQVDGKRLLQLTPDELPSLDVTKIGHQEIILQGVELLRNIHYQLYQENVQFLALRLSSKARSIYNELRVVTSNRNGGCGSAGEDEDGEDDSDNRIDRNGEKEKKKQERVSTAIIAGVSDVLASVKGLVSWLNRQPFAGVEQYDCLKNSLVELSIRLATIAQRDMFAENQATVISQSCYKFAQISDKIIQEYSDPLIIQPATLDIATIKKKADDELGVMLQGSYHGIHQVSGVRNLSPAHQCGKLEEGDELVQVNYQTVVGWNLHKVLAIMQESPVEVILTIKKPPRHANTQIYFKPFRLPSKKRTYSPWASYVGASNRYDLHSIPNLPLTRHVEKEPVTLESEPEPRPKSSTPPPAVATPSPQTEPSSITNTSGSDSDESDLEDDAFLSDSEFCGSSPLSVRLYHPKPRAPVQRRATIPGATARPTFSIDQLLQDVRLSRGALRGFPDSMPSDPDLLRGANGSDHRITRPHTCIGTEDKRGLGRRSIDNILKEDRHDTEGEERLQSSENIPGREIGSECKLTEKRVVNIIPLPPRKPTSHPAVGGQDQGSSVTISHHTLKNEKSSQGSSVPTKSHPPSVPLSQLATVDKSSRLCQGPEPTTDGHGKVRRVSEDRPKLDKSHSTPAYDMEDEGSIPVISPMKTSDKSPPAHASPSSSSSSSTSTSTTASSKFFNSYDPKSSLMPPPPPPPVPQQGSYCARNISSEVTAAISSNNGEGVKKHFRSQVVFPVVIAATAACNASSCGSIGNTARGEAVENGAGPISRNANVEDDSVHEEKLHGSGSGDGSNSARKCSNSSTGSEKSKVSQTVLQSAAALPPAAEASQLSSSSTSTAAVVLRETRSSSPSVWRRGLLVTDQGSRRISCRELGQGDHQGWLYRRRDNKGFLLSHRWERRWFILKKNYLYGYRDREAVRADSLIYLPGFHVCPASDVKSKKYAFKIYHSSGATFYFACDTSEERSRWMSQMGLSAISSLAVHHRQQTTQQQNHWEEVYYSETDEELEDRTSPSRRSPQASQARVSPSQENIGSLWRGSSASPSRGPQSRGSHLGSLGGGKNTALRFLQPARDNNQPVPTASFRSYRRVSESNSRSTSTGDLRGTVKMEPPNSSAGEDKGSHAGVTRKNSFRDRLKQIPASFTLERRKVSTGRAPTVQQDQQKQQNRVVQSINISDHTYRNLDTVHQDNVVKQRDTENSYPQNFPTYAEGHTNEEASLEESNNPGNVHRPRYMLPTCASSHHMPVRPSSVDLDSRSSPSRVGNGRWCGSPPSSGRCSPSKLEYHNRRGSVGGESPVRSRSPRRGSLDCLAVSHPRALSPPVSPLNTPTRSSHGSTSSLLASEEYREGSPEKLWINSLRSDTTKQRPHIRPSPEKRNGRSRSASGEGHVSERLKRTALYHPPQVRNRGDLMKPAFELVLDPVTGVAQLTVESKDKSSISVSLSPTQPVLGTGQNDSHSSGKIIKKAQVKEAASRTSTTRTPVAPRPEVPPRTKFLTPSERTLPISTSLSGSTPVITCRSCSLSPSPSSVSITSTKSTSSLPGVLSSLHSLPATSLASYEESSGPNINRLGPKPVPSLTITTLAEETTETTRTPLKPAMGVAMIGKQRRTPAMMSPREVFFTSPPASPTVPFSSNIPPPSSPTLQAVAIPSSTSHSLSLSTQNKVGRNQKVLPHYPGMEYPPVFEPGSYSLCGSPPDQPSVLYQNPGELKLGYASSETDSFSVSHSNFGASDSSLDMESSSSCSDMQHQSDVSSKDVINQRSVSGINNTSGSHQNNFYLMNPPGTRSPQNVYVSTPVGSRSAQNLYVTSPGGSISNQNLYVTSPTVRSSSHQNIYVTSPVAACVS
ncbi:serine-rich adhesin for platelets isoform X1 [Macrobrachium rosenbergii]|uniref:serine-rich adhesin for platelets isoform X1 n=2 Tax=Macrobrachium rosenbergii TaxID=79674 RepID=UPI0034D3C38A